METIHNNNKLTSEYLASLGFQMIQSEEYRISWEKVQASAQAFYNVNNESLCSKLENGDTKKFISLEFYSDLYGGIGVEVDYYNEFPSYLIGSDCHIVLFSHLLSNILD